MKCLFQQELFAQGYPNSSFLRVEANWIYLFKWEISHNNNILCRVQASDLKIAHNESPWITMKGPSPSLLLEVSCNWKEIKHGLICNWIDVLHYAAKLCVIDFNSWATVAVYYRKWTLLFSHTECCKHLTKAIVWIFPVSVPRKISSAVTITITFISHFSFLCADHSRKTAINTFLNYNGSAFGFGLLLFCNKSENWTREVKARASIEFAKVGESVILFTLVG